MTQAEFRLRFPEFRQVSDAEVKAALADALLELDVEYVWKTLADAGQGYLAAHKLSIAYADPQDPNQKNYQKEFDRLKKRVTSGFRVA